mgnify:CR=1 FL=1
MPTSKTTYLLVVDIIYNIYLHPAEKLSREKTKIVLPTFVFPLLIIPYVHSAYGISYFVHADG